MAGNPEPDRAPIHVFSEQRDAEGLQVVLEQKELPGVRTKTVEFRITIINRLREEVFVEVTELGPAAIVIHGKAKGTACGGALTVFPDNVRLLKRLHATTLAEDGTRSACACDQVTVTQSAELDLSEWIGCTGTLSFRVAGFYRASGKQFDETIELEFQVVEPGKSRKGDASGL